MTARTTTRTPTTRTPRRRRIHLASIALVIALCFGFAQLWAQPAAAVPGGERYWPVSGPVIRGFDPPDQPWLSGHRGIDIAAPVGTPVDAAAAGFVSWVGAIAGVPMISVTHPDGVRTTYQPVSTMVATGDMVAAGQQIGVLLAGHGEQPCLHLGLLRGDQYLDPLAWLTDGSSASPIRLLPNDTRIVGAATGVPPMAPTANGWPVVGPITSPFGWRVDPINGTKSFHSGTDIAAPCGTPVAAPIDGTVVVVAQDSSLGNYVVVSHAGGLRTTYAHLSAQLAAVGQPLVVGQVLGLVGQTGRATGCHLHFGATRDGVAIDSRTLLP